MDNSSTWKGATAALKRRILRNIDNRTKKKVGESELGQSFSAAKDRKKITFLAQTHIYALAMGISDGEALEKVKSQIALLETRGEPWKYKDFC